MFKKYIKVIDYLKESKNYFLIVAALFSISISFGFFFPIFLHEYIQEFIEKIMMETLDMGFFEMFAFIFENNFSIAFVSIILGIAFGIFPIFSIILNGYVIGYISNFAVREGGYVALLSLFPHGIFEIPAIIISFGLGLKLGMFVFAKNKKKQFSYDLLNSLRVLVFIVLPLLIIAAIVEALLITFLS